APAKYLFTDDFARPGDSKPTIGLAEHATKLKDAESAAFARGFAAATSEAKTAAETRSAAAFERIATGIETLDRGLSAIANRLEGETVEVAMALAKKLAPALIAREPLAEITALASECFRYLIATPHVVVRINDALLASARERIEEIARTRGLDG